MPILWRKSGDRDVASRVDVTRLVAADVGDIRTTRRRAAPYFTTTLQHPILPENPIDTMASSLPSQMMFRTCRVAAKRKRPTSSQCRRAIATHTHSHHANQISVLRSNVDTSSADFQENKKSMDEAIKHVRELRVRIAEGGPKKARDKHIQRGKMLPREYVFSYTLSIHGDGKIGADIPRP